MIAVVTGASSGIGRELARELAKRGFDLILVGRRKERLICLQKEMKHKYKRKAVPFVCDLSKTKECYRLYRYCKDQPVRVFVNNAGLGSAGCVTSMENSKEEEMIKTNLIAVHLLTKLFAKNMRRGVILNVSSTAAFQPGPGMAVYGATKAYVYQYSRAMNYELKKQRKNVRICVLCPGPVKTEFDKNNSVSRMREMFTLSPKKVAGITVDRMLKGKEVIIPGGMNRILKEITKRLPENLVLYFEYKIQMSKQV